MSNNSLTFHDKHILDSLAELVKESPKITIQAIADRSGVHRRTVSNSIARLVALGYIAASRESGKPYSFEILKASNNGGPP